jgi:hypothetical protein
MADLRCSAQNRHGERCGRQASEGGLCIVHGAKQDMAALGRMGKGERRQTKLRKAADDDLREKARTALAEALEGDDEKRRFEAAKSLFSYRAEAPPGPSPGQAGAIERAEVSLPAVVAILVDVGALEVRDGEILVGGERLPPVESIVATAPIETAGAPEAA